LRKASIFYSGAELFLVIGTDSFLSLPSWHQPERIAASAEVVVVERSPLEAVERERVEDAIPGLRCHFLEGMGNDISSTEVRQLLDVGQDADDYLPQGVAALIAEHHWYGSV